MILDINFLIELTLILLLIYGSFYLGKRTAFREMYSKTKSLFDYDNSSPHSLSSLNNELEVVSEKISIRMDEILQSCIPTDDFDEKSACDKELQTLRVEFENIATKIKASLN